MCTADEQTTISRQLQDWSQNLDLLNSIDTHAEVCPCFHVPVELQERADTTPETRGQRPSNLGDYRNRAHPKDIRYPSTFRRARGGHGRGICSLEHVRLRIRDRRRHGRKEGKHTSYQGDGWHCSTGKTGRGSSMSKQNPISRIQANWLDFVL